MKRTLILAAVAALTAAGSIQSGNNITTAKAGWADLLNEARPTQIAPERPTLNEAPVKPSPGKPSPGKVGGFWFLNKLFGNVGNFFQGLFNQWVPKLSAPSQIEVSQALAAPFHFSMDGFFERLNLINLLNKLFDAFKPQPEPQPEHQPQPLDIGDWKPNYDYYEDDMSQYPY